MQVGFSVIRRSGDVDYQSFGPPSAVDALLQFHRTPTGFACLLGRLYYREEMIARLPREFQQAAGGNDAALALAVYLGLDVQGLLQLEGDFTLVIWDAQKQCLLGLRDPLGGYPLFWVQQGATVALSNRLGALLELLPGRELDLDYLADYLALPGCVYAELNQQRCVYKGPQRVLAGSMIRFDLATGQVLRRPSCDWAADLPDFAGVRFEDIAQRYAGLLREAVRQRVRGRTACHLSGGMDSTSVALLARDCLKADGELPLHTLSVVYSRLPALAQERVYVDHAANAAGLLPHRIEGDDCLRFDEYENPPLHEEPCPTLHTLQAQRILLDAAASAGARTVLSGEGADDLLDVPPYYLADLLRKGRFWRAWREAGAWARGSNCSAWQILSEYGFAHLFPVGLHAGLGTWWRRGYASWKNQNDYTIPPWIRPGFARRYDLRGRALDHLRQTRQGDLPTGLRIALADLSTRFGDAPRWLLAAPRGLVLAHPFLDRRVLRFSLGFQSGQIVWPGGQKPLLGEAMRGVLPEPIRTRPDKGDFNELYFLGLNRHHRQLEQLIRQAPLPEEDWFDRDILLDCLQQTVLGISGSASGQDRLNLTLSLLRWLSLPRV